MCISALAHLGDTSPAQTDGVSQSDTMQSESVGCLAYDESRATQQMVLGKRATHQQLLPFMASPLVLMMRSRSMRPEVSPSTRSQTGRTLRVGRN